VSIPVIFYAVPETNPLVGSTCFVPRWWDYKDGYLRQGVGTDNRWRIYRGTIPAIPVKPAEGKPEWWTHGMSYEVYLANGYSNTGPCITVPPLVLNPVCLAKSTASAVGVPNVQSLIGKGSCHAVVSNSWVSSAAGLARGIASDDSVSADPSVVGKALASALVWNEWADFPACIARGIGGGTGSVDDPDSCIARGIGADVIPSPDAVMIGKGSARDDT